MFKAKKNSVFAKEDEETQNIFKRRENPYEYSADIPEISQRVGYTNSNF